MAENKIAYLELPSNNVPALKAFYGQLFGWTFQDFGDDYAAIVGAGMDGGFNGDPGSKSKVPLAIIETTDIEDMLKRIQESGGTITMPTFTYPGGQRFHFVDPSGNELAVLQHGL